MMQPRFFQRRFMTLRFLLLYSTGHHEVFQMGLSKSNQTLTPCLYCCSASCHILIWE